MDLNYHVVLIVLSSIVLISHFFNSLSMVLRIPSVLLLLGLGMLMRQVGDFFGMGILDISKYLDCLGTIGLILIVLEGTMDLKIRRQNLPIIKGSFSAALVILLVVTSAIAIFFNLWLKVDLRSAVVNAIPLGVISSAIAIPTVAHFAKHKKEFLTYEAIFSDILGIMFFNFMVTPSALDFATYQDFFIKLLVVIIVSIVGSFLLFIYMHNLKAHAKFFIVLSLLILVYSIGKIFHLSSLLLIFTFGLLLNNPNITLNFRSSRGASPEDHEKSLEQFKLIVAESAFLIRTFFFVVFGYSIDIMNVLSFEVLKVGIPVVLIMFLVRYMYLKSIIKSHIFPEIFIAPKGLVTILLFYSIPDAFKINTFSEAGVVLFVILTTSLLMVFGGSSRNK